MIEKSHFEASEPNHDLSGHPNTINLEYYTTEVVVNDFGDQYSLWEGRVNVMNNTDGISYAYDITKLQEMSVNPFGVKLPTSPANDNVPQNKSNSNTKNSLTVDSKGNELSEGQREYFKDSKAVDENGNLKVYYHGTSEGGFTVFDPSKSDDNLSLFFSDDSRVSMSYGNSLWAGRELKITNDQYKGTGKKNKRNDCCS